MELEPLETLTTDDMRKTLKDLLVLQDLADTALTPGIKVRAQEAMRVLGGKLDNAKTLASVATDAREVIVQTLRANPSDALNYARNDVRGPVPELEHLFRHDYDLAWNYAVHCLRGRFESAETEDCLFKSPESVVHYARGIQRELGAKAEAVILRDPLASAHYAALVRHRDWPEAEAVIGRSDIASLTYSETFYMRSRFEAGEEAMAKSNSIKIPVKYAVEVCGRRFPAFEKELERFVASYTDKYEPLSSKPEAVRERALALIPYIERFQTQMTALEPLIAAVAGPSLAYARALGQRFYLGEPAILQSRSSEIWSKYLSFLGTLDED